MSKDQSRSNIMLTSKSEFMQYLNCSEIILEKKYVPLNLPGIVINGRWSGSTEEIDRWWNDLHRGPIRNTIANPLKVGNGEDFE